MATQYAFGKIVTNGLVLCLDAADRNSYVSGSTTWFDVSGNNNSGSLINGPTFNTGSGGSIVFDGVDNYVKSNISKASFPNLITLSICLKYTSGDGVLQFASALTSTVPWILLRNVGSNTMRWYLDGDYRITQTVLTNNIYFLDLTYDGTTWKTYKNGVLDDSWTGNFGGYNGDFFWIGNGYSGYTNIQTYNTKLYNRALSASEVLQNYNAQKSRFGL